MDGGAWQATAYGIAKGWTQLSVYTHTHSYSTRGVRELGYSLPLPAISIIRWWREGCSPGINPICCLVTKLCPTLLLPHGL